MPCPCRHDLLAGRRGVFRERLAFEEMTQAVHLDSRLHGNGQRRDPSIPACAGMTTSGHPACIHQVTEVFFGLRMNLIKE